MNPDTSPPHTDTEQPLSQVSALKWMRRMLYSLFGVAIFLLVLLLLVLYSPPVQNFMVDEAAKILSRNLQTTVSIDRIDFNISKQLSLRQVYVKDLRGDTLLYADKLHMGFKSPLTTLINGNLYLSEVALENAQFQLYRDTLAGKNNLALLLEKVVKKSKEPQSKNITPIDDRNTQLVLDLDKLQLKNVVFYENNVAKGNYLSVHLGQGTANFRKTDLSKKTFDADLLHLKNLDIRLSEQKGQLTIAEFYERYHRKEKTLDSTYIPLQINADRFWVEGGSFTFDNERRIKKKLVPPQNIDYDHLRVHQFRLDVDDFHMEDLDFRGSIRHMSLRDSSGFSVTELRAETAHVSEKEVLLADMVLQTPYSHIGDTLHFTFQEYEDFEDFENRVRMNFHLDNSHVALRDIMVFESDLYDNPFFINNFQEQIHLDGRLTGKVNDLRSDQLQIVVGSDFRLTGNFNIREITQPDETFFFLKVNQLQTGIRTLKQLVPNLNLPPTFYSLGQLNFSGNASGFTYNFVADGKLHSDIGQAVMDMQFIAADGENPEKYSGNLTLSDFDVGRFVGDRQLGKVTLTTAVRNGSGLTASNAQADLRATIGYIYYRDYRYNNIDINGSLNQDFFKGAFDIADDNIRLSFNGDIQNLTQNPEFDLRANVSHLDLFAVNISKKPLVVSGNFDVNLLGKELTKLYGTADIRNLHLLTHTDTFATESLMLHSTTLPDGSQEVLLNSDIAEGRAWGRFDLALLPKALFQHLYRHHPHLSRRLALPVPDFTDPPVPIDFMYVLDVENTKNLFSIFEVPLDTLRNLHLKGEYSNLDNAYQSRVQLRAPYVGLPGMQIHDAQFVISSRDSLITLDTLHIGELRLGNTGAFELGIAGEIVSDSLFISLMATPFNNVLEHLSIGATMSFAEDQVQFSVHNSDIKLLSKNWTVNPDNRILIGKDYLEIADFSLSHEDKRLVIQEKGDKGLRLKVENFDLSYLNEIWQYKPLNFYGTYDATVEVTDVFQQTGLKLTMGADEFLVNSDNWGVFSLRAVTPDLSRPIDVYMHIGKSIEQRQLIAKGTLSLGSVDSMYATPNSLDLDVSIENYPLDIAEYFIGGLVSQTEGRFGAEVHLWGPLRQPNIQGELKLLEECSLFVNYLQAKYRIPPHTIPINNYLFDVSGVQILDIQGNAATLSGGMTHHHLKDLGLDVRMRADRFVAMNTRKGDNDVFYGKAIAGDLLVHFQGPLPSLDLDISGRSLEGTVISIPFGETSIREGEQSFIRFIEPDTLDRMTNERSIAAERGLDIDLRLEVTEDALINLIFDEKSGDVIQGRGVGNLNTSVSRSGEFTMSGTYDITEGEYLFTLYDLVNKPFAIDKNSRIRWTGNPLEAEVDIKAIYKGIKTPVTNLIFNYLQGATPQLQQEAAQPTQVDLILQLKGQLLHPEISFEIQFPELLGSLRNVVDSRMITLYRNPNALNYQVFGLIVTNSFLPPQSGAVLEKQYVTGINTVSELLANQLSRYLTELVSEIFTDVSFVSGVDMDIAANYYEAADINNLDNLYVGTEVEVASNFRLINDKVLLRLGGNYSQSNAQSLANNQLFSYDLMLELILTKDKRYRLRFYHRTEPEITGGLETRTGIGLTYRREFDNIRELFNNVKKLNRKDIEQ